MLGDIHASHVLYRERPQPGHRYRQIAVVEMGDQFQLYIFGGDVIRPDPQFSADSQDAEVHFYSELQPALDDAEAEVRKSLAAGWSVYGPCP
jgi:hypothetical protein